MRIFLLLCATVLVYCNASAQGCNTRVIEPTYQAATTTGGMSCLIQNTIGSAELLQKIGELPNGDFIFLASGINKTVGYAPHECLLIKSNLFGKWEVLGVNPSRDSLPYTLTVTKINTNWEIEVAFKKGTEVIPAKFSLKQLDFIFTSPKDEEKLKGQLPHVNLY